jgi:hypothetical protein
LDTEKHCHRQKLPNPTSRLKNFFENLASAQQHSFRFRNKTTTKRLKKMQLQNFILTALAIMSLTNASPVVKKTSGNITLSRSHAQTRNGTAKQALTTHRSPTHNRKHTHHNGTSMILDKENDPDLCDDMQGGQSTLAPVAHVAPVIAPVQSTVTSISQSGSGAEDQCDDAPEIQSTGTPAAAPAFYEAQSTVTSSEDPCDDEMLTVGFPFKLLGLANLPQQVTRTITVTATETDYVPVSSNIITDCPFFNASGYQLSSIFA